MQPLDPKPLCLKRLFYLAIGSLLVIGCAQQVPPSGGPKDTTPPQIIQSIPKNFQTGVYTQQIVFEFDEYVRQQGLVNELLVSPPLKYKPEFDIKGKKFFLTLEDTLRENVTYQFNFGEGLVDITEGNPLDSNVFVFSTGDYLDSLTVSGSVKNAFDLSPAKDVLVMLYRTAQDSIVCKEKPLYYTRSDEEGNFTLRYLAHGTYQLFALEDNNSNFLYDLPNEKVAFLDAPFTLHGDTNLSLRVFEEPNTIQFVKSFDRRGYHGMKLVLNLPVTELDLHVVGQQFKRPWYFLNSTKPQDSTLIWIPSPQVLDTADIAVIADGEVLDTNTFIFPPKPQKPLVLKPNTSGKKTNLHNPYEAFRWTFNLPLLRFDSSKTTFIKDSVIHSAAFSTSSTQKNVFELQTDWEEETTYHLWCEPGTFATFGDSLSDSLHLIIKTKAFDAYGNVSISIGGYPDLSVIVQLWSKDGGTLIKEAVLGPHDRSWEITHLPVSSYQLKAVLDVNNNGKWDSGSYGAKKQPETVLFYSGSLEMQKGFDSEISWELEASPIDTTNAE